ncbi:MAG: 50S ribosomal protein L21 [Candidatus Komeilibacteria bacterium]
MFAVIKTGGKQYVVQEGQSLRVEKLEHADGKKIVFSEILLVVDGETITVGNPTVKGASVEAQLVRDGKAKKVIVGKYHAKTRYKRTRGHRQQFTEVKISAIKK